MPDFDIIDDRALAYPEHTDGPGPVLDIVVPVYNEAAVIEQSIERLHAYLTAEFPFSWRITIANNASTDATLDLANELAARLSNVVVVHLDSKGRGLALRAAWLHSDATVVAYTDVDLSTGLDALLPLVAPLISGHSDVAIGSRLSAGSNVARGPKREVISRCYNIILRVVFSTRVRDAQCGFKALRTDVAAQLIPAIENNGWFFDSELLLLAEHNGLRVHEVPVDWVDDPDSRVHVRKTALEDLRGVLRVAVRFTRGRGRLEFGEGTRRALSDDMGRRFVPFAMVGAVSTAVSLLLFISLRERIGSVWAVIVCLAVTNSGNAWAHRRWTLGRRHGPHGQIGRIGHGISSMAVGAVGIVLSALAVWAVDRRGGSLASELAALAVAWTATSAARYALISSLLRSPVDPQ